MATRIGDRDRKDFIKKRKAHFNVKVNDASPEDKRWGLDAAIAFTTTGYRDRVLRFSREEIVQMAGALTEWLSSRTA